MDIHFDIVWPGGNTTALVTDEVAQNISLSVAHSAMKEYPEIEQVGFIQKPNNQTADLRLHMMGGEFCGNATRAAAYWFSQKHNKKTVTLEVSGIEKLITASVAGDQVTLFLDSDFFIKKTITDDGTIIDLQGIRHFISNKGVPDVGDLIKKISDATPAVGIITVNSNKDRITIDPVIWVREMDSLVNETACGSGTIATALALYTGGSSLFEIWQPSGECYSVALKEENGVLATIEFTGKVVLQGNKIISI